MCVGSLAGVTYLHYTVLTSSNKSETAVHCCDHALSVLVMLMSRNVFHVVLALQYIVFIQFFLADQVSCRFYVGSAYRMRSLAVIYFLIYVFLGRRGHFPIYVRWLFGWRYKSSLHNADELQ